MSDVLVARYVEADETQQSALQVVEETARTKRQAVLAMREQGLTFAQIGSLVGLSVAGVQRYAYGGRS